MHSGLMVKMLARHLNWRQGLLVPEAMVIYSKGIQKSSWGGGDYEAQGTYLADLMWVTRDLYATEIEIKVSRADWRADAAKDKWGYLPPWVSRFIYAVPEELGIPDWVPEMAGIWHVRKDRWHPVKVVRAPRRIGKEKVPQKTMDWWRSHLYYRYWERYGTAVPATICP